MTIYAAPLREMRFLREELFADLPASTLPEHAQLDVELMDAVLREAGRFCSEVLLPLNLSGDTQGCTLEGSIVRAPQGFREAYRQFVTAGWSSIAARPEHGGQGLPTSICMLVDEMNCSANMSFSSYTGLAHAAYKLIRLHGSEPQQRLYLPKLAAGSWSATMCLTEPQCGTDLALVSTRAEARCDGSYRISGAKIFVSGGEHDLTENIVHLVLARLSDAPAGIHGLSLFVVPKFLPQANDQPDSRNTVTCTSIEHKMGMRAASTCSLSFDGATGWLIGEPHHGMRIMFTMMNAARLAVAVQGVGLSELACQNALAYAKERHQGRAPTGARYPDRRADPIIVHPDVRKNLLTMKALTEGIRALAMWVAVNLERAEQAENAAVRCEADDLVQLLTPIVKSFASDAAFEVANLGVQIYGGHGYIREHGMEQIVRDARITQLYEGTNGVQAMDLVGRKIRAQGGRYLETLYGAMQRLIEENAHDDSMQPLLQPLAASLDRLQRAVAMVMERSRTDPNEAGAAASDLMGAFGYVSVGFMWARMARLAMTRQRAAPSDFYRGKIKTARFYMEKLLPRADALLSSALAGGASIMDMEDDLFDSALGT